MSGRITFIAIAIGGACGALTALVGWPSPPPSPAVAPAAASRSPMQPITTLVRPPSPDRAVAVSAETGQSSLIPSLGPNLAASASAGPVPPASAASSAPPSLSPLPSNAETAPLPSTEAALLRAEMHCDQKDTQACILAARSYETGSAGPTDPEKAVKYRKIALTLWMSQCDHNSAAACATLWEMYRTGRGVPRSERNATALLQRTRELCHYSDVPVCHELPPAP